MTAFLPSPEKVRAWQQELNNFGPRLTGSPAHKAFIDFLQRELEKLSLPVTRDELRFTRWAMTSCNLAFKGEGSDWKTIPVSSSFPYSGHTGPDGVEGEIVYYERPPFFFSAASGKIAVIDVGVPVIPKILVRQIFQERSRFPETVDFTDHFTMPVLVNNCVPDLKKAEAAGVLAVVCVWRGCSADNAAFQYLPFTSGLQNCPALWVSSANGDLLKEGARGDTRARLRLEASVEVDCTTHNLHAVVPGNDPAETIIVNTHTDGTNACEENGPIALLALASALTSANAAHRLRTVVFAFVSGHFQLAQLAPNGQATSNWLESHPELWDGAGGHRKAVAGVTIEHLGAMEWKDDETASSFRPTGLPELELVYTANAALDRIYIDAVRERMKTRTMTLKPMTDLYFGEGQPLYQAGIPTISLIPTPDYLCAAPPGGYLEKLDPHLQYEQIGTFARVLAALDKAPADEITAEEFQLPSLAGGIAGIVNLIQGRG